MLMETENKDTLKVEKVEQETTEKTYTKQDLDNSFNAGVKKANSEWQKDEKYKEFMDWKKNNQNDSEKYAELQNDYNKIANENKMLKAEMKLNATDVKKEFSDFVISEVLKRVNDTTDFDKALDEYKKEKPQFFGETQIKKVQSSPKLSGGGEKPQTTNDIMNNFIRNN